MDLLRDLASGLRVEPNTLLDIFLTAILIYLVLRLIQGTRAVRLAIGASIVYAVYVVAQELDLRLLSGILQTGAVVGLVALVVVFQPELRRGLDRLGRLGSWAWLGPADSGGYRRVAAIVAAAAAKLARRRTGALIVVERDTGLGDMAEAGVMINADLSAELLASLFAPGYPLHDGAVIVRDDEIVAAAVMLPLTDREGSLERYGTRHRAALGLSEQTDALVIVVSEESGGISLAQGGTIVRNLGEDELRQRLFGLLAPADVGVRAAWPTQPGAEDPSREEPGAQEPGGAEHSAEPGGEGSSAEPSREEPSAKEPGGAEPGATIAPVKPGKER